MKNEKVITKEPNGKGFKATFNAANFKHSIRFSPYALHNKRSEYDIEQIWGLDQEGKTSRDFIPFLEGSIEAQLVQSIKTGYFESFTGNGWILADRPRKGGISRNLCLYDPDTNYIYTLGGLGLIKATDDITVFNLEDPKLKTEFSDYQRKHKQPEGGTVFFTNEGIQSASNTTKLGVAAFDTGPYSIDRKIRESIKFAEAGINAPQYIAAGKILNLGKGEYGFSIYRSQLTPEYMLNLDLFLDQNLNFTPLFNAYIADKYRQLGKIHSVLGESHGQPTVTNALLELKMKDNAVSASCQIKDFATNKPLPDSTKISIDDGIAEIDLGFTTKKSPRLAAIVYDLQVAITQELNVLFVGLQAISDLNQKVNFIAVRSNEMIQRLSQAYGLNKANLPNSINFAQNVFVEALKKGVQIENYNKILGGLYAHAIFAFSQEYHSQIRIMKNS